MPRLPIILAFLVVALPAAAESVMDWKREFPKTDFRKHAIDLKEITSDGAVRDSIPPVREPIYVLAADATHLGDLEPVISIGIAGDLRAYPLSILLWHEIVNDVIGGVPVLVSYCPLCNSGVVFDRRLDGRVLSFGNTGRLRHYDMVMYDHQTESWWQQFEGRAIIGALSGKALQVLPARLESLARFRERAPDGIVLIPENASARDYGATPYVRMERARPGQAWLPAPLPDGVWPFQRVVVVGKEAWTLELLRAKQRIEAGGLVLTWSPGQNSIHDSRRIAEGRDVGNVVVQRGGEDVAYDVAFAFAFAAFVPDGTWNLE